MKALLIGLEVLTVHVKGYTGDHHQIIIRIDDPICIFCKGKFQKDSKSQEKLTQAVRHNKHCASL